MPEETKRGGRKAAPETRPTAKKKAAPKKPPKPKTPKLNKFRKTGRPSKYVPELLEAAATYLEMFEDLTPGNAADNGHVYPSIEGLAAYCKITRETVYQWKADPQKEVFKDIVDRVLEIQAALLLNGGLTGAFNSTISKLLLARHDYVTVTSHKVGGENGEPVVLQMEGASSAQEQAEAYKRMLRP